jgi:hypothetical protein
LPPSPEFQLPPRRDRGWWWAIAISVLAHVLILSVRATDWFWAEGRPPEVRFIPLQPDLPQVDMPYRREPRPESQPRRPPREVTPPVAREPSREPAGEIAVEQPGVPQAPRDTAGEPVPVPGPDAPRGIARLRPRQGEGKLWVQPLPLAPQELAQRLTRSHLELVDSAVSEIVQNYIDSLLTTPTPYDAAPPSWTTELGGKTFGIDQKFIHLGGLKIPTAVLALLPIPQVSNVDLRTSQRLADIRADLQYAAQRSQNMEDFKRAIRELRERRQREQEFERNQRRTPADTTRP